MKKVLFVVCLLIAAQWVQAQMVDSIFAECKEAPGAMNLHLTKEMLKMAMALQKDQKQSAIVKKIDLMKMVVIPSPDSLFAEKVTKELEALESDGKPDGYTKVMMGQDKSKDASQILLIKAEGEETVSPIIREFLIGAVAKEKGQQVLLVAQVLGRFDIDDLDALMRIASRR